MKAKLTFTNREQAEDFALNWTRHTLTGHTIGSGTENVVVSVYGVTDGKKAWINEFIKTIK